MNTLVACLLAATVPASSDDSNPSVYRPTSEFIQAIRGQSPMYEMPASGISVPQSAASAIMPVSQHPGMPVSQPGFLPVSQPSLWNPLGAGTGYDPFLSPP
ncbi:MAG: hypothetical protein ABGZ17_02880, partial [Planctomycetaceae bacterium]